MPDLTPQGTSAASIASRATLAALEYGSALALFASEARTDLGRAVSSVVMLIGWGILAVPTGIVTSEMTGRHLSGRWDARTCPWCGSGNHHPQARFCHHCGKRLPAAKEVTGG